MIGSTELRRGILALLLILAATSATASDGFFTVGEEEGRAWLFDPDGERFFSAGVCVTTPDGYYAPDLGYSPYYENIMAKYGSREAWATATAERLHQWNFTSLGAWSDLALLADEFPYTVILYLSGSDWQYGNVPDYFAQDFFDHVDAQIAAEAAPRVDDPNLIGYFLDNELRWGPDWRGVKDLFGEYFAFPADAPGKIALVDFLADRYGDDVGAFNAVWNLGITTFDDLLAITSVPLVSFDATQTEDRDAVAGFIATQFYSTCHDAIRAADPNHLILGARFVSWVVPRPVVEAITDYTDVVSVNHYELFPVYDGAMTLLEDFLNFMHTDDMLTEFHDATGKPILISEFSIRSNDAGLPNTWPPNFFFHTVQTQEQRADFFENYARQTFATGFVVGYHWFAYMDEPPEGRFDGENSNFGLVDNMDDPWQTLVDRMTIVNADAYTWPIPDDDTDDDTADDTDDDDSADDSGDDTSDDSDDDSDDDDDDDADDTTPDDDSAISDDSSDEASATTDDDDDAGCCG